MQSNQAGRPVRDAARIRIRLKESKIRHLGAGLCLAAALLLPVRAPAQSPPPPPAGVISDPAPAGMISWWPGDGNANDIYSTNNGTLMGGATATNVGVDGTAFVFDGVTACVAIPDAPALHPTNFTIEAWMRCDRLDDPTTTTYPGQQYIIFHQNNNYGGFEGFDLAKDREPRGNTNKTTDTWCFEMTSVNEDNIYVESQTFVQTNVWYHIAGVRGSNYIQIYVNGVMECQSNIDFPVAYGPYPLYFASTGQSYWDQKFAGALDEIGFYDRVLSSNEIHAIYAAGRKGRTKTPTALSIAMTNGASAAVKIAGIPGQSYGVQTASSPTVASNAWIGLTNLTLSTSADVWVDPSPATNALQFYRVLPGTISVP
jgi:hypothetical protein